jgi:pyruvate/2-oxoglutarate dehydrogenase complex dihydrolipoamide acyltransferase (E2) component
VTDVFFPDVSGKGGDSEGVVATWFVSDGEQVAEGGLLAEVAVDKVNVEITAPAGGTLRVLVAEGQTARQGAVIARLD